MNFTGNEDIKDEYLEIITHRHSGLIKRQANNYRLAEREENKNESVRNRK
jgi:hypothetical protein